MQILISDRDNAPRRAVDFQPTHLVTFNLKDAEPFSVPGMPVENALWLDINKGTNATKENLLPLLEFLPKLPKDAKLFICCDSGVSRSSTTALLALCVLDPKTSPATHFQTLRTHWPRIVPQRGMVRMGDALLGLGGELERCLALDAVSRVDELQPMEINPDGPPRPVAVRSARSWIRRAIGRALVGLARRL